MIHLLREKCKNEKFRIVEESNDSESSIESICEDTIIDMLQYKIAKLKRRTQALINDNKMLRKKLSEMSKMPTFWQQKCLNQQSSSIHIEDVNNSKIKKSKSKNGNYYKQSEHSIYEMQSKQQNMHEFEKK
eukprot:338741_1